MRRASWFVLVMAFLGVVAGCGRNPQPSPKAFPQAKTLDARTAVILTNAWICASPNTNGVHRVLRARFIFDGEDPNKAYGLHAALRGNQQGEDSQSKYVWYVGLSPNFAPATNKVSMMWEFRDFPTNTTNIYLREYFVSKSADGATNTMDFVLPGAAQLSVRDTGVY